MSRTTMVSLGLFCAFAAVLLLVASSKTLSSQDFDATIMALYLEAGWEWGVGTGGPPPPTSTPYPSATLYPTATFYPTSTPCFVILGRQPVLTRTATATPAP